MPMELRSLSIFVAVAENGSFTRAGRKLRVSQSAVSQQIRALEQGLGSKLFTRQARKVSLTQAGSVLLPYAKQIIRKVEEAVAVVSDLEGLGRGKVAIGAGAAVCHHLLPPLLSEFSARFGKIEVQVISGFSEQTLKRTLDGTVDLGIVLMPINNPGVVATEVGRDELLAIAPKGHAWEALERVKPKDFIKESLVTTERESQTFRIFERFLIEAGVFPTVAMEIGDTEAVKRMVEAGLGVSIIADWASGLRGSTNNLTNNLVVRPLGHNGIHRSWGVIRRANESPTASQREFIKICAARMPGLMSGPS